MIKIWNAGSLWLSLQHKKLNHKKYDECELN